MLRGAAAGGIHARHATSVVAAVLGALATVALMGATGATNTAAGAIRPRDAVAAATGPCAGGIGGRSTTLRVAAAGRTRTIIVHTPTGDTGRTPIPLVLNLHGSGSTAPAQEAFTGMDATANTDGFLVAYPQGAIAASSGFDWNVPGQPLLGGRPAPRGSADDVAFLSQAITYLSQHYCVDTNRVFATGFSGGARLASQLGCDQSARVAAIAPVSGLRRPTPCPTTRPVPVISFHGTADPVDPYNGNGQRYWTYSVPDAAQRWATQDGCSSTPSTTKPAAGAELTTYGGCGGSAAVELYTINGAGHTWPGGPPLPRRLTRLLGPQSTGVDANALMWSFFAQHSLR
jgi:polyhydroxybutyrate depolymerase